MNTASNSFGMVIHGDSLQITIDSRMIASEFDREHKNVLATLDDLIADGTISQLEFKPRTFRKRGREYRCIELNEAGI